MSEVRAIVAGHGDFAAGMLSAVEQITGRGSVFVGMTNRSLGAADVHAQLARLVDAHQARVIFTDLPAGSCTIAARRLQKERRDVIVVMGANLAALLDFAFAEETTVLAAGHAAEKGREALSVVGPPEAPRGH